MGRTPPAVVGQKLVRGACLVSMGALVACVVGACNDDPAGSGGDCVHEEPAFVVTVTASDGALPPATTLTVRYGGSINELYELGQATGGGDLVFCEEQAGDAGEVVALVCELYTGQAAEVTLREAASLDPWYSDTLTLERDDADCVLTRSVELVFEPPDAGT